MSNFKVINLERHTKVWLDDFDKGYVLMKKTNDKSGNSVLYLRCKDRSCKGSAKIKDDTLFNGKDHVCASLSLNWDIEVAVAEMKHLAATTVTPCRDIYTTVLDKSSREVQANLTWPQMERKIRHQRKLTLPQIPKSLDELEDMLEHGDHPFQDYYKGVVRYHDRVTNQDSIGFIFIDNNILDIIAETKQVFVDGTFKTRPHPEWFGQILNILVEFRGTVVPVAHCLLTHKFEGLYNEVWSRLKTLVGSEWKPEFCMADYERGLLNSLRTAFPNARVNGCRFHFGQSVLRKIRNSKLAIDFVKNEQFNKFIRKHFALCLLPAEQIGPAINLLRQQINSFESNSLKQKMTEIHTQYFSNFWLKEIGPEYITNFGLKHRTNNASENLHSKFNSKLRHGTTIWNFLANLRDFIIKPTTFELFQSQNDLQPRHPKRKVTLLNDKRIILYEEKLSAGRITPIEFLSILSYNFSALDMTKAERDAAEREYEESRQQMIDEDSNLNGQGHNVESRVTLDVEAQEINLISEIDLQEEDRERTCAICYCRPREYAFVPCGHRVACSACNVELLKADPLRCSVCRTPAIMTIRVVDS
jgi:hypothetical protein